MSHLPPNSLFREWNELDAEGSLADAIALQTANHRMIENLFGALTHAGDGERRQRLTWDICAALRNSILIEEEIVLPALCGVGAEEAIAATRAGYSRARLLIAEIEAGDHARVATLAEAAVNLFKAKEAPITGLFAKARASGIDLVSLRDRIIARRETDAAPPATAVI